MNGTQVSETGGRSGTGTTTRPTTERDVRPVHGTARACPGRRWSLLSLSVSDDFPDRLHNFTTPGRPASTYARQLARPAGKRARTRS